MKNLADDIGELILLSKESDAILYRLFFVNRPRLLREYGIDKVTQEIGSYYHLFSDSKSNSLKKLMFDCHQISTNGSLRNQLIENYKNDNIVILRYVQGDTTRIITIAPNADKESREKYPLQLSQFILDSGAIGDSLYASIEDALKNVNLMNFDIVPEDELEIIEDNLCESEAKYQEFRADYIEKYHHKTM
ncbi:MAG: hypothetical protein HAW67_04790 [Endozoicomonadaceae bacterium]|nr:hypothetical protein [Endozoicomonadaceae bacterium]